MSRKNPTFITCGHDQTHFTEVPDTDTDHHNTFPCGACQTTIIGKKFSCNQCSFSLHPFCKTPPPTLSSPLHTKHTLTLVAPSTSSPAHICDVCFEPVRGIYYTCGHRRCDFDVHPQCSQLSPWVRHALDPLHCLELQHRKPRTTCCDVCRADCSGWGYRCGVCSVDVHYWCLWKPAAEGGGGFSGSGGTTSRSLRPHYQPRSYEFGGALRPTQSSNQVQQPFYFGYPNYDGYGGNTAVPYWWPAAGNYAHHNPGGGSGSGLGVGSSIGAMGITGSLAVNLLSNLTANLIQNGFLFG